MKDHLIGSVPAHLVDAARPTLTAHEGLVADYNIAAWLHLPDACDLLVSLVVSYLDGGRQREVAVDHGRIDRQQRILLSGIARLPVRQKVENMQVRLKSATAFSPTGRGGVLRTSGGAGKQVTAGVRSLSRITQPWRT